MLKTNKTVIQSYSGMAGKWDQPAMRYSSKTEHRLGRTSRLISRLWAHLEKTSLSQVAFANAIGHSSANLSEILRGNNSPNSETALHMLELLESKSIAGRDFQGCLCKSPYAALHHYRGDFCGLFDRATLDFNL